MQCVITSRYGYNRISAKQSGQGGLKIVRSFEDAWNADRNHQVIANEILAKLGWLEYGDWVSGTLPNGDRVWVCTDTSDGPYRIIHKCG